MYFRYTTCEQQTGHTHTHTSNSTKQYFTLKIQNSIVAHLFQLIYIVFNIHNKLHHRKTKNPTKQRLPFNCYCTLLFISFFDIFFNFRFISVVLKKTLVLQFSNLQIITKFITKIFIIKIMITLFVVN